MLHSNITVFDTASEESTRVVLASNVIA